MNLRRLHNLGLRKKIRWTRVMKAALYDKESLEEFMEYKAMGKGEI